MRQLTLKKVGNELVIDVTALANEAGLVEGDQLIAVKTLRGFEFVRQDAAFETAMTFAKKFMLNYPRAMKHLAD
ncbi:MAG: hypothetical protein KGO94_06835 [Alphaproteobacteria bacterium]|nr:hypothetical protein [Alphaproteobacteria bacterium]